MRRSIVTAALCAGLVAAGAFHPVNSASGSPAAAPADLHSRLTLAGNTRPEVRIPGADKGPVPDTMQLDHLQLQLRRLAWQERAFERVLNQLYNPRSRNFHRWLTASQLGHEFGPPLFAVRRLKTWLVSAGLSVNAVHASRMVVDFSGSAGQVRRAFGVAIHYIDVNGNRHIANIGDPQVPATLAPFVAGIVSLSDFRPQGTFRLRQPHTFKPGTVKFQPLTPSDIATIYDLKPLQGAGNAGRGQTIALIENSNPFSADDWKRFRAAFGLARFDAGNLSINHPNAPTSDESCKDPGTNGNEAKASLDAEWASAAAPDANVEIVSCRDTRTTFGGLIALQNLLNSTDPPPVVGIGYSLCEPDLGVAGNAAYYDAYQQAAAEGVSVFVSAGNGGGADCDAGQWVSWRGVAVNGLASTPYDTAVGGTDFADTYGGTNKTYWSDRGAALSYIPEIPWNDSCVSTAGAIAAIDSRSTAGSSVFCGSNAGAAFWQVTASGGGPSGCSSGAADPKSSIAVSGTCAGYRKPRWQSGAIGDPDNGQRDIPDISLFAGDGAWQHAYSFCWSDVGRGGARCEGTPGSWPTGGGTSFAASIMAGIQALIDQKKGSRQGNPDPVLYAIAARESGSTGSNSCNSSLGNEIAAGCPFRDVTLGDSDVNCTSARNLGFNLATYAGPADCALDSQFMGSLTAVRTRGAPGFGATTGWDFATGLGSIDAAALADAWH